MLVAFDIFDEDKNQVISVEEFTKILGYFGSNEEGDHPQIGNI